MGNGQGKSSESFSGGFRHGSRSSVLNDLSSRSKVLWQGSASGRLSLFSDRVSSVAQWSWRSGRSAASTVANWPRRASTSSHHNGSRWSTLGSAGLKTNWPVSLTESLFLPEFPVRQKHSQRQFDVISTLGSGAYGKVYHVREKKTSHQFALKVLSKSQVVRENAVGQVKDEVCIQTACGHHRYIVSCPQRWQTRRQIYVLEQYVCGGDMYTLWMKHSWLDEKLVQLFVAQLAIAIEFLHNAGVVYRDLKLQNVLLDADMNVQLTDFGLAKWLRHGHRTNTICGTLRYMAPEILDMQPYSHCVDWWSLGVMSHCLLTGEFPFEASSEEDSVEEAEEQSQGAVCPSSPHTNSSGKRLLRRRAVLTGRLTLPARVSEPARHLVSRLLTVEPRHRLSSLLQLSRQGWFKGVNLDVIGNGQVRPRTLYEELHAETAVSGEISGCNRARSDDFIDFDASTVGDDGEDDDVPVLGATSGGLSLSELREEFPLLPRRVPLDAENVLREMRSKEGPCMTSTPVRQIRRVTPPAGNSVPVLSASNWTSDSTSGDLLELCLPVDQDLLPKCEDVLEGDQNVPVTSVGSGKCVFTDELKETTLPQSSIERQSLSFDNFLDEFHIREMSQADGNPSIPQTSGKVCISEKCDNKNAAHKSQNLNQAVDQRFTVGQCCESDVNKSSSTDSKCRHVEKRTSPSNLASLGCESLAESTLTKEFGVLNHNDGILDGSEPKEYLQTFSNITVKPHTSYDDITEGFRVKCLSINDTAEKDESGNATGTGKSTIARKFIGDFLTKERLLATPKVLNDSARLKADLDVQRFDLNRKHNINCSSSLANQVAFYDDVTQGLSNQSTETDNSVNIIENYPMPQNGDCVDINNKSKIFEDNCKTRESSSFHSPSSQEVGRSDSVPHFTKTTSGSFKKSSSLNNVVGISVSSQVCVFMRKTNSESSRSSESVLRCDFDAAYKRLRSSSEDGISFDYSHLSKKARQINSSFN